ncbi:MAG: SIS domain-containing protein, partial [Thermoanaerobaculia bacterium]
VLKLTRVLVPMTEGELVEFTAESHQLYALRDRGPLAAGALIERTPTRSRQQARDAALLPRFETFMEQEIVASAETCRRIQALFSGGSAASQALAPYLVIGNDDDERAIDTALTRLRDEYDDERIRAQFFELLALPAWRRVLDRLPETIRHELTGEPVPRLVERLASLEAGLLTDLIGMARTPDELHVLLSVRILDALIEREEVTAFQVAAEAFVTACRAAIDGGGRIFFVCCGSSFHAALAGAVFFNELARTEIVPVLPGEFRGRFARSLRAADLVVAISQSGETKDLIDVLNLVIRTGLPIRRVAIVNNASSTLGQEKCDLVLPLRCGPEIAVPATKSFTNQMAMLYALAIQLGRARLEGLPLAPEARAALSAELEERFRSLEDLPRLITETLATTEVAVEAAAELLFLRPSLHILATRLLAIAKEGALKIREVVLNHTEGFEASEFKHGPNTILGVSTIFGIEDVVRFTKRTHERTDLALRLAEERGLPEGAGRRIAQALADAVFSRAGTPFSLHEGEREIYQEVVAGHDAFDALYEDYPLVFVTGPDETDVSLTVSQVNTHKIRGTTCVMVAEDHPALRQALTKPPADNPTYRAGYIALPRTNDNLMACFSATVVLQRLALRMSLRKKEYLDRLGFEDHGVHPDVPKNVSKSITVD